MRRETPESTSMIATGIFYMRNMYFLAKIFSKHCDHTTYFLVTTDDLVNDISMPVQHSYVTKITIVDFRGRGGGDLVYF